MWSGLVAEWAGFGVGTDEVGELGSVAPLIGDLRGLRPLPGADATTPALTLVEPVLVAAMQRALRWAVVGAVVLLRPDTEPGSLDAELPCATGPAVTPTRSALELLREREPLLMQQYDALVQVEGELAGEVRPSKQAGGHMDVRPDDAVVDGLLWRSVAAGGTVALLGRRQLAGLDGPLLPLVGAAYDLLGAVSPSGGSWPDDAVRSLRQVTELALVLTVSCRP